MEKIGKVAPWLKGYRKLYGGYVTVQRADKPEHIGLSVLAKKLLSESRYDDDGLQSAILQALEHLTEFEDADHLERHIRTLAKSPIVQPQQETVELSTEMEESIPDESGIDYLAKVKQEYVLDRIPTHIKDKTDKKVMTLYLEGQTQAEIAKKLKSEIISGDSMQVYKKLDIGTAKVSVQEQKEIKHHLIDIKEIDENYSVYDFQKELRKKIEEISNKNMIPIIVGGTGFYLKAALYDYVFLKEEKNDKYNNMSNQELLKILKEKDIETYKSIDKNNNRRILRAVQMLEKDTKKSDILRKQTNKPIYELKLIGLTIKREELYENINKRVEVMVENGLIQEAQYLFDNYYDKKTTALQAIGYKEFFPYFKNEKTLEECKEDLKKTTRNYAKRQYTWFNNKLDVKWFDRGSDSLFEDVMRYINE